MKKVIFISPYRFICLLVCLKLSLALSAQTNTVNLNIESRGVYNDSLGLIAYDSIFRHYEYSNPDSELHYMKQGLALFTSHKYKPGIAGMLSNLGGIYSTQGMLEIAKKATADALKIFTEINNKKGIANTRNILGVIEGRSSNYAEAINNFFIALKIYEEVKDTDAVTDTYIKLAKANEMSGNLDKSLEYLNKGLSYLAGKPANDVVIFLHNNIGAIYISKNDYLNAMKYLQKALDESRDPAYAQIRILPLTNMGVFYTRMKDTNRALTYLQEALDTAVKKHLPEDKAQILMTIADLKMKRSPEASVLLLNDALQTSREIGERSLQTEILNRLIGIYQEKGNFKEAYSLLNEEKNLSDSVLNIDKEKAIANLEALYDLDNLNTKVQQLEWSEQKQQQRKNAIIVIAVLLAIILFVVVFFLWKTRLLNAKLSKRERQLNKASMVKNKLISIIAHDLIGSIGFMPLSLRLTRDKSIAEEERDALLDQLEINANASFETLQNMLDWGKAQIQGISLNQKPVNANEVSFEVLQFINIAATNKGVNILDNIAPGTMIFADLNHFKFILRNLLSNAVKHSHANGLIEINTEKSADTAHVVFSIKDTGGGISRDRIPDIFESGAGVAGNENNNGIGLKLSKEFVLENGGAIWVKSEENKGAVFYFSLKANKE